MRVASKHDIPEYEIIPSKLMWKETKFKLPEVSKYPFASCATTRTFCAHGKMVVNYRM